MSRIDDYRRVAPPGAVDFILKLAEQVKGRRFLHVTGGRLGGGGPGDDQLVPVPSPWFATGWGKRRASDSYART